MAALRKSRQDDIAPFNDDDSQRRVAELRFNGEAPEEFRAVLAELGPEADFVAVGRKVFSAYETASRAWTQRDGMNARALAEVRARQKALQKELKALQARRDAEAEAEFGLDRLAGLAGFDPDLASDVSASDFDRMAELAARVDRLDEIAKGLDGRGRPPTRLRHFVEELAVIWRDLGGEIQRPSVNSYGPAGKTAFQRFVAAATRLVDKEVPEALTDGVINGYVVDNRR